jgi:hypothetical protein
MLTIGCSAPVVVGLLVASWWDRRWLVAAGVVGAVVYVGARWFRWP